MLKDETLKLANATPVLVKVKPQENQVESVEPPMPILPPGELALEP